MTVCNMSIEAGARAGMIAPDETTFDYVRGREFAPQGLFEAAVAKWKQLPTDPGAKYDKSLVFKAADITPQVTWGTNPGQVAPVTAKVPNPGELGDATEQKSAAQALEYMGLKAGTPLVDVPIDRVFIGSCTNARIEDLRAAAAVVKGHQCRARVNAMVVPGSSQVKVQAEEGRARPRLQGSRLRLARGGLQHVPGHESRQARAGRALRLHQQPQLRRAARQRGTHASGVARDGRRRGDRRPFCGYSGVEVQGVVEHSCDRRNLACRSRLVRIARDHWQFESEQLNLIIG